MKIWLCTSAIAFTLWACNGDKIPNPTSYKILEASTEGSKIDPEKLYKINCRLCHGKDGKRGLSGAPDISISTMGLDERIAIITHGKGVMAPFGNSMSEKEIKAVAKYTMKLNEE